MSSSTEVYKRRWYDENQETSYEEPTEIPVDKVSMEPETRNGIVCNAKHVNVREQPFKTAVAIGTVKEGEKVTILDGPTHGFYKIAVKCDTIGFLSVDFCKEV